VLVGEIEKSPGLMPVTLVPLNATVTGLVFATITVSLGSAAQSGRLTFL